MEMGDLENVVLETDVLPLSSIIAQFRPYITAIKSKPFILLAGISGTGKSRIVRQLAYATGGENPDEVKKPYNYRCAPIGMIQQSYWAMRQESLGKQNMCLPISCVSLQKPGILRRLLSFCVWMK